MSGAKTLADAGIDDLVANTVKACNDITKAASRRATALKESCKSTLGLFSIETCFIRSYVCVIAFLLCE